MFVSFFAQHANAFTIWGHCPSWPLFLSISQRLLSGYSKNMSIQLKDCFINVALHSTISRISNFFRRFGWPMLFLYHFIVHGEHLLKPRISITLQVSTPVTKSDSMHPATMKCSRVNEQGKQSEILRILTNCIFCSIKLFYLCIEIAICDAEKNPREILHHPIICRKGAKIFGWPFTFRTMYVSEDFMKCHFQFLQVNFLINLQTFHFLLLSKTT